MNDVFKFFKLQLILFLTLFFNLNSYADNHNIYDYNDGKKKTLRQFAIGSLNFLYD